MIKKVIKHNDRLRNLLDQKKKQMTTQLIFFRLKKEDQKIKGKIIRYIRNLFEQEEQDH